MPVGFLFVLLAAEQELAAADLRVAIDVECAVAPSYAARVGSGIEVSVHVLPYLRVTADVSGAWAPALYLHESNGRGVFRTVMGADGVLRVKAVELFVGLSGGFVYSNVNPFSHLANYCFDCGSFNSSNWEASPALRVRGGLDWITPPIELLHRRSLVFGASIAYGMFGRDLMHWLEFAGRIGMAL